MKAWMFILAALLSLTAVAAELKVHFVDVGDGVNIEVLDWGSNGIAVILLAGSGNTGHVFEDFASKLADCCHVYAITRRGYGASSKPQRGYSVPELATDVYRIMGALKITKPVLVGHSMAGSEITWLGQMASKELGGLVYLDSNADPLDHPWSNEEYRNLVMKSMKDGVGPPKRTTADNASVEAYQEYQKRTDVFPSPAGEIRAQYEIGADGTIGKYRTPSYVSQAIDAGSIPRDYRRITVPVLAFFPVPTTPEEKWKDQPPKSEQDRVDGERIDAIFLEFVHRWQGNLKRAVPSARIVEVPGGHHYLFQNEEALVLREMLAFFKTLEAR
jgi:non-heme chloroperoxidase